jgi:hypothetical protein
MSGGENGASGGPARSRLRVEVGWVTRGWLPPLLLLAAFFVIWPVAGFPWWPLVFVVGLSVLGRLLGFGPLIRRPQGAAVLAGLLVVATLWAWSPWLFVIAAGAALGAVGWWRAPRRRWLAGAGLGLVLVAAAGWSV